MPDVLTLWSVAVLVVGGLMYLLISRTSTTSPSAMSLWRSRSLAGSPADELVAAFGIAMIASAWATSARRKRCI